MSYSNPLANYHEDSRHKEERSDRGEEQSPDDRAAKRRVLFAALAKSESHRHHADDHRCGRHQDRP